MSSVRRRPRLAKSTEAVMQFVEDEVARLLAADPTLHAARQRAVRRAGPAGNTRAAAPQMAAAH